SAWHERPRDGRTRVTPERVRELARRLRDRERDHKRPPNTALGHLFRRRRHRRHASRGGRTRNRHAHLRRRPTLERGGRGGKGTRDHLRGPLRHGDARRARAGGAFVHDVQRSVGLRRRADWAVTDAGLALSLRGVTKRFGSTVALDGARFDVRVGTLHALLGENGAGKTTLMRLVFGMLRPDAGSIEVDGMARRWRSSADAIAAGIGMVHQHFLLVPAMTVGECVSVGVRGLLRGFDTRVAADRVRTIGRQTGLVLDPAARVADIQVGAQQRLEIIKALARDAKILILDEPTAVLSPTVSQELYSWLRSFVARGRTVVLITHKVREAL